MHKFHATIEGNEVVGETDAREAAAILCRIIHDFPGNEPAVEALVGAVERMDSESVLTAYLDWWLVVVAGAASPLGKAFRLPPEIPPEIADLMAEVATLANSGLSVTAAEWLAATRQFRVEAERIDELLDLETYGASRLPDERSVWETLQQQLFETTEALRNDRQVGELDFDSKAYNRALETSSIDAGSRRWNNMLKRANECVAAFERLVELQRVAEPWRQRDAVGAIDEIPAVASAQLGGLAPIVLAPLLAPGASPEPATTTELAALIDQLAIELDDREKAWLASLVSPWIDATGGNVPALDDAIGRRSEILDRIGRLESAGLDLDVARLHLLDNELDEAMAAVDEASDRRRDARRSDTLRDSIKRLRAAEIDEAELERAEALLAAGDLTACQELVQRLDTDLRDARRAAVSTRLAEILDEVESLNGPASVIEELSQQITQVREGTDRPGDTSYLDRAEQRLVGLRTDRAISVSRTIRLVRDRLDSESERFSSETLIDFDSRLSRIEDLEERDLPAAYQASIDLEEDIESAQIQRWYEEAGEDALVEHLLEYCTQQLDFDEHDIRRLHVACKTKPFVILAGLTGSGKSTLARLYAAALGADGQSGRFRRIAVRPDWIDQSEVLGSVNPLNNRFQPGWLAEVALQCSNSADQLHFVLLDEMNLAPVEQYLAEYLSALEEARSGSDFAELVLYPAGTEPENAADWPATVPFPPNLVVIGTVNVDETTRALSERVLDRANVLQLSVRISSAHHNPRTRSVQSLDVPFSEWEAICIREPDPGPHEFLVEVGEILQRIGIGVGQRSHTELERFIANARGVLDEVDSLDLGLLQRIIPKIRGFRRDLDAGLVELAEVLDSAGCRHSGNVVERWLADTVSDDEFLDGTDARVGLLR